MLTATGERDMEQLGGLIHRMPVTAFAFLVGCVAISALPPLNGFVSEWLTFQAILQSPELPQWGLKILVPAVGGLLALSAALAAACFVKAFGVTFLGRPRSPAAAGADEVDRFTLAAMLGLARAVPPRRRAAGPGHRRPGAGDPRPGRRPHAGAGGGSLAVDRADRREPQLLQRPAGVRLHRGLGRPRRHAIHRFASRALRRGAGLGLRLSRSRPGRPVLRRQLRPADPPRLRAALFAAPRGRDAAAGRWRRRASTVTLRDRIWDALYAPLGGAVGFAADRLNGLQFLTIRRYLSLVFAGPGHPAAGAGAMAVITDLLVQGAQMALVLLLAPLLTGFVRKVKARLLRGAGRP